MNKIIIAVSSLVVIVFVYTKISAARLEKAADVAFTTESQPIHFSVNPGESVRVVAQNLENQGVISDDNVFVKYAKKTSTDTRIKPGEYTLDSSFPVKQVLAILVAGDRKEAWITIPEGWRIDQIGDYLEGEGLVTKDEFIKTAVVKNFASSHPVLSGLPGNTSLEGYLFPDTYKVFAETTASDIIDRMLANFSAKVTKDMMNRANSKGLSLHEFITLASIVEKESAHSEDIAKISSVYWNRLNSGMLFQSDATITYITKRPDPRPSFEETRIESPYNTYIHSGLPPGPVGNPGLYAIEATLAPEDTPYLFFVSKGDRAYFATTYEGHLENIAKYLD